MTVDKYKENLMKIGVLLGQVAPHDKELYMTLAEAVRYSDRVKEVKMTDREKAIVIAHKKDNASTVIESMFSEIEKFTRLQLEYKEKTLAEIIEKYDFIVGSKECKYELMKVLPEGANVVCSPYIENPTMIYAIKKFDIIDYLFTESQESEDKE